MNGGKRAGSANRLGRPRRFEPERERVMLMDAARRVIGERGYRSMTVNSVLAEAGLSTRAFYRHFSSHTELSAAVREREMVAVEELLEQAVRQADGPVAGVEAWLEQFITFYYPPWRQVLVPLFFPSSEHARYRDLERVMARMRERFCRPLVEALEDGAKAGILTSTDPTADAYCIHGLVNSTVVDDGGKLPDQAAARQQVLRFVRPALGLTPTR